MHKCTELKIKKFNWLIMLVIPLLISACGVPNVEWELKISGDVSNPITLTFTDLAKMELINLNDVLMEKSRGEDEVRSFSGVPLDTLLKTAGASDSFSTITAIAADGYAIEISKDEMVNGIVAIKQGDKWIVDEDPDAGPIRLVFPTTPADHWVFQVIEIIVNP
ncbi:MAG: molybdopterin-dependent oxidoreductase [Chloroflexota bacterium]|nr:molybdopterin-dependent oxidoreductase [Chloroflexota bacterium]